MVYSTNASLRRAGRPEDYQAIHDWFDETKAHFADFRHRALRHHSEGIFMAERQFGTTITISTGRVVPVRLIGEQHVTEDCGFIPTVADWLKNMTVEPWMRRVGKKLSVTTLNITEETTNERTSTTASEALV